MHIKRCSGLDIQALCIPSEIRSDKPFSHLFQHLGIDVPINPDVKSKG